MTLLRRHRKRVLVVSTVVVLGAVLALQLRRGRVDRYEPGEETEGIVDTLARDLPEDPPPVRFVDVSTRAGLVSRHFEGRRTNRLPEDMGGGVALADVNGDGWTDVFLPNVSGPMEAAGTGAPSRLFLNLGDGTFEDATRASGIDLVALCNGAAFVDVDSDGDLDLFVATYGTCRLFENDGAGRFHDVSREAGLADLEGFWTGVAVADYDLDGAMDVYVTGYVRYEEGAEGRRGPTSQYDRSIPALINPSTFEPHPNLLLAGEGDGTFLEVAEAAGVRNASGRGLGALFCDLDDDGLPDLYVANDVSDNALYLNRGDGTFADLTSPALVGDYRGAMGLAAADFDGDLDLDLFVTHWVGQENALYRCYANEAGSDDAPGHPVYFDEADRFGLGHTALDRVGWATRFFDYDNDGRLDLFVVNGSTIPTSEDATRLEPMRSQLFWHSSRSGGFYYDVGAVSGEYFGEEHVGRGGATFDYDLDGDEDLLVVAHGEPAALLRNDGGNAKGALRVRLRQAEGNRFAVGARLVVTTSEGRSALDVVGTQGSYLSQHAVGEVAFGLGDASFVEELRVAWPDGEEESFGPLPTCSLVEWTRGAPPSVRSFPGRRERDVSGPATVDDERRFFALRDRAQEARLAGDLEDAVRGYLRALSLWPGHADCLYYLGNTLTELGRESLALSVFERLVGYEEHRSAGWMQIGLLRLPGGDPRLDDLGRAREAFERCHALNREESRPTLMLGVVALLDGRHGDAERLLADAARLNPRSVEARWFAGRVAFLQGDTARAEAHLREAHELAGATGAGDSASNEGDTSSGGAMTSRGRVPLAPSLERWRTTTERAVDVELEYGEG